MSRFATTSLLTLALTWMAGAARAADNPPATDTPTKPKATAGKDHAKGDRLPPYFAKLVTTDQREAIYKIDDEYAPKIKDLQKQLHDLEEERNGKIRAVLTPDQQKKLDEYMAERKAAKSGKPDQKTTGSSTSAPKTEPPKPDSTTPPTSK